MKKSDRKQQRRDRRQQNAKGRTAKIIKGVLRRFDGLPKKPLGYLSVDWALEGDESATFIEAHPNGDVKYFPIYGLEIKTPPLNFRKISPA